MDYATHTYDLYHDIRQRTGGEIYIGVLGPVRTGKSTFIKRFMEEMVLPNMEDTPEKTRAMDEMPQSAGGKTITTTEPKFIPSEAVQIHLADDIGVKVRLIDCVGYMVEGAVGHMEGEKERMVKTPWFEQEIPFTQAAEIGTDKVMQEHSTIGMVITTDGSVTDLPRDNYLEAEEKTILALKKSGKPFLVLLNTAKPYSEETKIMSQTLMDKYGVCVVPVNCEQLKKDDIHRLMEKILYEFPIKSMDFFMPKWVELLPADNEMRLDLIEKIKEIMGRYTQVKDVLNQPVTLTGDYLVKCKTEKICLWDGTIRIDLEFVEDYYYKMLSEMIGVPLEDEYGLIETLKNYAEMKNEYDKVIQAVQAVRMKGYGVVTPAREEITLEEPELIKHGNKYGIKIKAVCPSIHMIRANIQTEIAPIVGTKEQAQDLIDYVTLAGQNEGIWETNIFGKTIEQLVEDGITGKILGIGEESQLKLQNSMQKIVNESNGGMVCIII